MYMILCSGSISIIYPIYTLVMKYKQKLSLFIYIVLYGYFRNDGPGSSYYLNTHLPINITGYC